MNRPTRDRHGLRAIHEDEAVEEVIHNHSLTARQREVDRLIVLYDIPMKVLEQCAPFFAGIWALYDSKGLTQELNKDFVAIRKKDKVDHEHLAQEVVNEVCDENKE